MYDSSLISAFTYICLRSVTSLNRFWSCMSTDINIFTTVIEAVYIDLLIISEYIICIIQCCTLSFEKSVNMSYSHFDRASALSFWFSDKYSIKKLYHEKPPHLSLCKFFNCHKVFQILVICINLKTWHTSQFCISLFQTLYDDQHLFIINFIVTLCRCILL